MSILVSLHHVTRYRYDRPVGLGPQIIRLRPAPHCRTADPELFAQGHAGRAFRELAAGPARQLARALRLSRERPPSSPSPSICSPTWRSSIRSTSSSSRMRENFPFAYPTRAATRSLRLISSQEPAGPLLARFLASIPREPQNTVDFLVELNQRLQQRDPLSHPHGAGRADAGGDADAGVRLVPRLARGCWCRSCATSASRRVSCPAISSSCSPT